MFASSDKLRVTFIHSGAARKLDWLNIMLLQTSKVRACMKKFRIVPEVHADGPRAMRA